MSPGARLLGLMCLAATWWPASAAANGTPDERLTLTTSAGRVVVESSPIRLSFFDRTGRVVLRQVGVRPAAPRRLPPTDDPEPFAVELKPDRAVYAPFTFEVGSERLVQWNAGLWTGNMLFARRSGVVHRATRMLSARRSGTALKLRLATTDRRRRLLVTIAPDRGGAVRVRARTSRRAGVMAMADSFASPAGEGFHGFGGRHGTTDKRGQKLYGWTEQENLGGRSTLTQTQLLPQLTADWSDFTLDELGGLRDVPDVLPGGYERYMVPNGQNAAYYPQAQFVSSRGYGFLLNRTELVRWRMANDRRDAWQVHASTAELDYTVALGPGAGRAAGGLTAITGRHRLPPAWAQGPTLWRAVQVPALPGLPAAETAATYRAKIERDLADIARYDPPITAYAFEGWALLDDLDYVRDVIRRLRERGIRAILYHRAYVSDDALATQPPGDSEEVRRLGLEARNARGEPYVFGSNGGAPGTLLDFTNPRTVRWWRKRLELSLELGAQGFMQDFGEQVQAGMRFHDGSTGRTMHNRYPVLWHRISRRIVDRWAERHPKRGPVWFFTRSGYSGRPGSAAYEMGTFPGDETTEWSAGSGLRSLAPDMLNRAVGGAFGYTADIGGYIDSLAGPPNEELFNRWSEWTALTPYFRLHNSASTGTRMPWFYGPATLERWKRMAGLHQRALPYIRRLWREGRRTGIPPTRPMWLAAPEVPRAGRDQQWLLGPDVLVAPVVVEGATSRRVWFPRGCWRSPANGRRYRGGGSATVAAPLGELPYFIRCGTRPFGS